MIGLVNANLEATLRLTVRGDNGEEQELEAVIDTGFTGFLTLPPSVVNSLHLTWLGQAQAVLGDGSLHQFDVYATTVIWDGQARLVEVDAAEATPLVGMGLLHGYELRIQIVDDGAVSIDAIQFH